MREWTDNEEKMYWYFGFHQKQWHVGETETKRELTDHSHTIHRAAEKGQRERMQRRNRRMLAEIQTITDYQVNASMLTPSSVKSTRCSNPPFPPQPCLTLEDVWHSAVWPSKRVLWFHMHCRQRCHSQGACSDLKHCALEMFLPPRPALAEDCQHRAMFSSQCWGQGVWIKMGWSKEENKEQKNGLLGKHTYMQACTHADASTHTHTHKHNNNNQTCKHIHTHSWTNTHII